MYLRSSCAPASGPETLPAANRSHWATETAIRCGVIEGVRFEIEGYVTRLRTIYPQLQIFLTGGGRFHLPEQMLQHFRYDPHLVSRGLNRILGTPPSSTHTTHIDDE